MMMNKLIINYHEFFFFCFALICSQGRRAGVLESIPALFRRGRDYNLDKLPVHCRDTLKDKQPLAHTPTANLVFLNSPHESDFGLQEGAGVPGENPRRYMETLHRIQTFDANTTVSKHYF